MLRGFIAQRPLHHRVGPQGLLTLTSYAWAERSSHKIADDRKKDKEERERSTEREGCTPEPKDVFRMEPTLGQRAEVIAKIGEAQANKERYATECNREGRDF